MNSLYNPLMDSMGFLSTSPLSSGSLSVKIVGRVYKPEILTEVVTLSTIMLQGLNPACMKRFFLRLRKFIDNTSAVIKAPVPQSLRPRRDLSATKKKNDNRREVAEVAVKFYNGRNEVADRSPNKISRSQSFEHAQKTSRD